jgi:hypothetical protein
MFLIKNNFSASLIIISSLISLSAFSDSFTFNTYNNHGVVGLINMPTARIYGETGHGITIYNGSPDQKITLSSNPFDWMEASFFYMNIEDRQLCRGDGSGKIFCQGYKDKGFNFKARIKKEGLLPAIAIGINDIAGTGLYSSEYIVASHGVNNLDIHYGIGWGELSGSDSSFKNPLGYLNDRFKNRPERTAGLGGQFQPSRYFSGNNAANFYGISYAYKKNILFKIEKDTTLTPGQISHLERKSNYSIGIDYLINDNLNAGIAFERGNNLSLKFIYKNNPKNTFSKYKYKEIVHNKNDSKYDKLIKNLETNGIGVNKIIETADSIGIEITQFMHPDINVIEEIISAATMNAGIDENVKTDMRIVDLQAYNQIDDSAKRNSKLIYERKKVQSFNTNNRITFRPFLASRESFFKGALLYENNSEYILRDNFLLTSNLKYSLWNNFEDLTIPPKDTFPAQVRSDVKEYLRNFNSGIIIGRAQFDYHKSIKPNHHIMITGGILEEMFSGIGGEYIFYDQEDSYAIGFEAFYVRKRDYKMQLGLLEYKNTVSAINFYYRNYNLIPFDLKVSYGEYLAGDIGSTIELSRSFQNGTKFGVFASFTDVSTEQFGEGSFDKGIFFNIPVYGNFINYTWRPLTKDPGAKLNRKHTLYDLLVKFRPIN